MTPLAAKMFRLGHVPTQRQLAASQFFECTALISMAIEMRRSDPPESGFSENARLPAPRTLLEAFIKDRRVAFALQEREEDGQVSVNSLVERDDGLIEIAWQAAFVPGTHRFTLNDASKPTGEKQDAILIGLFLVEKLLCIINQPGLLDLRARDTDKRVMRQAAAQRIEPPKPQWHECYIRPGIHGPTAGSRDEQSERQLHYVRKHLKPSLGPDRWIDGYWRGNADLGIYLKHYVVKPRTRDESALP